MPLPQRVGRNSALRVSFLTDSSFDKLSPEEKQRLKVRALRRLERNARYPVREDSNRPDATFLVYKTPDGWKLVRDRRP